MLYFAFGSNMNLPQMKKRCPGSRLLSAATLENFQFVYDGKSERWGGAVGNVISAPGKRVIGGLFEIKDGDLMSLDQYEGFPIRYKRKELPVKKQDGEVVFAIVYFREGEKPGLPSDSYRVAVVEGARDCGVPEEYIKEFLDIGQSK